VIAHPTLSPITILSYLYFSPFGSGWVVRVDNLEDVVGGHIFIGVLEILGRAWPWARRAFAWSGILLRSSWLGSLFSLCRLESYSSGSVVSVPLFCLGQGPGL